MMKKLVPLLVVAVLASMLLPAGNAWKTPGFWKNRGVTLYNWVADPPQDWRGILMADETPLDDALAFEVLGMNKRTGDATKILAFQLIAAILNVDVLGAWTSDAMDDLIADAVEALNDAGGIGADPEPGTDARDECIYLAELLDDLNNDIWSGYIPYSP